MAVVSLGLLCALLLAVIIWMVTKHTAERDQQQRNMDQLQLRNTNLAKERDQQQRIMDQLEINKTEVDQENHRVTSENNALMKKNSILTAEKEKLQNTAREYSSISNLPLL